MQPALRILIAQDSRCPNAAVMSLWYAKSTETMPPQLIGLDEAYGCCINGQSRRFDAGDILLTNYKRNTPGERLSRREQRQIKVGAVILSTLGDDVRAGQDQVFSRNKPYPNGVPVSGENTDQTVMQLMGHSSPPERCEFY